MRPLRPADILDLADDAETAAGASHALAILSRAMPERGSDALAGMPVGRRDAELLAVRAATFGARIALVSDCPRCGATLESGLKAEDVGLACEHLPESAEPREVLLAGRRVLMRPATAGDLAAAEALRRPAAMRAALLSACVLAVDGVAGAPVPDDLVPAVEAALADLDPQAEVELEFDCSECGEAWTEYLDPPTLIRFELATRARRILAEVAELARAFHWSERDILALSPARRRFYLEAARA